MGYWTSLRVKIIDFGKRNRKKILIALIIWFVIIIINYIYKNWPETIPAPATTYTPHVSVIQTNKEVPEKYKEPIEDLIQIFFNHCNNKEYQNAYDLITQDCKNEYYPTLEDFKTNYVDLYFEEGNKIYNIQCYSIIGNKYIYSLRVLDDILATGTTGDDYTYKDLKLTLIEENGKMKLAINEFIEKAPVNVILENEEMIVEIVDKVVDYSTETYEIKITNKTDNYIVISDKKQNNEVLVYLNNGGIREPKNMDLSKLFIKPNSTAYQEVQIVKYADEAAVVQKITFGAIRVLKEYNWLQGTTQENLDNAVRLYGLDITL